MTSLFGSQSHLKATALGVPAAAIKRGIEAQRLRQELLGDVSGLFCRPRVRRGTLGRRFGTVLLPKRAVRHSWATFRGCSVARRYGTALLGNVSELFCCPSARRGTLGRRFGAVLSPEGTVRHSWATFRGCSVARRYGTALLGNVSELYCCPRGQSLGVEGAMSGGNSSWRGYILSLKPARRVSGQKWKTEDISPAMQKPQSRH